MPLHGVPRRWLASIAIVGVLLAVQTGAAQPLTPAKPLPVIPVVKTFGDLQRQPAIEVSRGVSVRFGIEAAECPAAEGMFVYCLTDGYAPPEEWSEDDRLGPAYFALTDEAGKPLDFWGHGFGLVTRRAVPAGLEQCQLLFLRRVVVVRPGTIRVRVVDRRRADDARMLASAEVKGAAVAHPWVRFDYTGPDRKPGQSAFAVRNAAGGPALPSWPEMCPLVAKGKVDEKEIRRAADEALPRLVPAAPSPQLELSVADGVLTVRSKPGIGTFGPDYHFLARWWVNGKPVAPTTPAKPAGGALGSAFTEDKVMTEVRLRLDLALDRLGAKPGDELGLQLLYCEHGSEPVSAEKTKIIKGWDRDALPLLSNRVTFRVK